MRLIDADNFIGFMTALEEAGAESVSFDDLRKFIQEQDRLQIMQLNMSIH